MIKIGTSGFQFEDWIETVYPKDLKKEDMLSYYENNIGFNALEINFTYYRLPYQRAMEGMMRKTSCDFEFAVRSYREMTHEIWVDEKRTKIKDNRGIFDKFLIGLQPMIREKRLGCVLLQFPYYFVQNDENSDYILRCKKSLPDLDIVVEFRHSSWVNDKTFGFLSSNDLGFCIVDEPRMSNLMPTVFKATSSTGYLRLHGRSKKWFQASKEERYLYDYSESELKELVPGIKEIEPKVKSFFIFFNNCSGGHAVENAKQMKGILPGI